MEYLQIVNTSPTSSGLIWESPAMDEDHTWIIIKFLRYVRNKCNKGRKKSEIEGLVIILFCTLSSRVFK